MTWGRIDDDLHLHEKWVDLTLAARGLWTTALSWTCRRGKPVITDGVVRMLAGCDPSDLADELVSVGMWHKPGHGCDRCEDIDHGYVFHDWDRYQHKTTSEKRAEAGRKGGKAGTGAAKARTRTKPTLTPEQADPKQTASNAASRYPEPVPVPVTTTPSSTAVDNDDPLRGFPEFWDAWPKRGGRKVGKNLAQDRWRKLNLDDRRAAYRGARHYATASEAGHQGAMDAWRWLRDRMWIDFQEPGDPTARGRPERNALARLEDGTEIPL
jgi:hypothetical protein